MDQPNGSAESYRLIISDTFYPSNVRRTPDGSAVTARFATRKIGCFRKTVGRTLHSAPIIGRRSWRDIERRTADEYLLLCPLSGEVSYSQFGRHAIADSKAMVLIDAKAPYSFERRRQGGIVCHYVPGPVLRQVSGRLQDLCGAAIPTQHGLGNMIKLMFASVWHQIDRLDDEERLLVMRSIAGLLASACHTASRVVALEPPSTPSVHRRAIDHIERCLDDPELDARRVAEAIGISVSHLHAVMQKHDTTVGRTILGRRLERCAAILAGPDGREARISEIAFRWGFNDAPHFSRSFRDRFACSPSAYREAVHAR